MALNSAGSDEGAKIFLPAGTYDLGEAVKTIISGKNVSLIGRSAENTIIVNSYDKQVCGQIAAEIRSKRPPEPYHGKGVMYDGEVIRRMAGKAGK